MKICVAQTKPIKGDIAGNIAAHKKLIGLAVANSADAIFFPELSITGYEPELAKELATDPGESRLDVFQEISNENNITIAVGMPTKGMNGILITMIIFQPHLPRQAYSKQHLHSDEIPFFINGNSQTFLSNGDVKIAPGICYETSLAPHWENAHKNEANIYVASVAKTAAGLDRSAKAFPELAKKYSMHVLLSNCIGPSDNFISAGKSAIWDNTGILLAQLDDIHEGILIYDTANGNIIKQML
jgi:predicted amidohydrolase